MNYEAMWESLKEELEWQQQQGVTSLHPATVREQMTLIADLEDSRANYAESLRLLRQGGVKTE